MSSFRVNTPLASTNSLRLFSQSQAKMETAIQRLSSGLRINSAKEDAAGQAISQRMQNQIRGQKMAGQNIKSGVDLIQTAEGGMDQIQNILGRMRELAVQSASDNLNVNDRESIDLEYQQLKEEVNRIANSTEYNEMKLLDGGRGGTHGVASSSTTTVDGVSDITDLVTGLNNPNGITIHNDQIYWTAPATDKIQRSNLDGSNITDLFTSDDGLANPYGLTIHNNQIYWSDYSTDKIQRADLNLVSDGLGDGTSDFTLQIGSNNTTSDQMTFGIDSTTTDSLQLSDTILSNLEGAQTAINSLDAAIDFLNDQRSNLGAISNRLEFAHSNVYSSIQNTEASLSTIRDADFAVEAANLAKSQILTQAGSTMLAQANNLSQNILSLIQ